LAKKTSQYKTRMKFFLSILFYIAFINFSQAQTYTLDHYLLIAKNSSPLLKDFKNQVLSSRLDSLRLRAGLQPQVNGNGAGLFAPSYNGFGYAGAITNVHTLSALVSASKALVRKDIVNSQLAAIDLQRDSIVNLSKISEHDLKKAITAQYITAYGSLQAWKFSKEVVELLGKEEELLKNLTRANVYRQSDYLTFLVTLKQQELQIVLARQQYKNDYTTLNFLTGIADTTIIELVKPELEQLQLPDLSDNIFFRKYQIDSLRLLNYRKLIDFNYKPKANIFADGGFETDFTSTPYKNFGTSIGFNITIPIYDGGVRKIQYRRLALQEETRLNYRAFFNTQYQQQIAQLKQQISESGNLLKQIEEEIKYSETLIKADTQLLQTGDLKIADFVLAVNNYLAVKNLLTTTNVNKMQLINQLNYWNK